MKTSRLADWRIVCLVGVALAIGIALIITMATDDLDAAHSAIRFTARVSVTMFLLAFTASSTFQLWPNAFTRWQRQNRRYFGLSFALSHFTHLGWILTLRAIAPAELAGTTVLTWLLGGLAYVFIAAMTATSFDRTARALGPKAWMLLHTIGAYYVWLIFANSFISRALQMPGYILPALAVVGALMLRIAARVQRRRGAQRLAVSG